MVIPSPTYYPRLATGEASALLMEYSDLEVREIADRVDVSTESVLWYPTAPKGNRVKLSELETFRSSVVEIARAHGYPRSQQSKSPQRVAFDRGVVRAMPDLLALQPVEAANEQVWNFLSLRVAPDVALWRWPNLKRDPLYERIIGRPRNVFRRLWWRSYVLGSQRGSVAAKLHEDEAVAILERTLIGGNSRLSRVIAETHIARFGERERRTEVLRDAMKRIRRLHAFLTFHALTLDELTAVVAAAFDETETALFHTRVDVAAGRAIELAADYAGQDAPAGSH
jgi:hypothetical protein